MQEWLLHHSKLSKFAKLPHWNPRENPWSWVQPPPGAVPEPDLPDQQIRIGTWRPCSSPAKDRHTKIVREDDHSLISAQYNRCSSTFLNIRVLHLVFLKRGFLIGVIFPHHSITCISSSLVVLQPWCFYHSNSSTLSSPTVGRVLQWFSLWQLCPSSVSGQIHSVKFILLMWSVLFRKRGCTAG